MGLALHGGGMNLKAKKAFTYRTRRLQAGDEFQAASARDYKLLLFVGRAVPVLHGVPEADHLSTIENSTDNLSTVADEETPESAVPVRAQRKRKTKTPAADPVPTGDDPYPTDEE